MTALTPLKSAWLSVTPALLSELALPNPELLVPQTKPASSRAFVVGKGKSAGDLAPNCRPAVQPARALLGQDMALKDKNVAYYYDEEIGNFNYGGGNPMRPHRVRLTHSLVENYDLKKRLRVERPLTKNTSEVTQFHADGEHLLEAYTSSDRHHTLVEQTLFLKCSKWHLPLVQRGYSTQSPLPQSSNGSCSHL